MRLQKPKKQNVRRLRKFKYYLEDCDCKMCQHYRGKKRGCALPVCCCEDIKEDTVRQGRLKRDWKFERWDA